MPGSAGPPLPDQGAPLGTYGTGRRRCKLSQAGSSWGVPENRFVGEIARTYDQPGTGMFADGVLEATIDCLVELTDGGAAMEFAIGTGRVAVPLAARGVPVSGIELSADMLDVLRSKPEASDITAVEGDMAVTFVEGEFSLVYLAFNTIQNLTTQDEQVACFENAARHLRPGGRFAIETSVPGLRQLPPGNIGVPFAITEEYIGIDDFIDRTHKQISRLGTSTEMTMGLSVSIPSRFDTSGPLSWT